MQLRIFCLFLCFFLFSACGAEGKGTVTVTAFGETFIEAGIPVTAFADGWAVNFSRFELSLAEIRVAGIAMTASASIDLTTPSAGQGQVLGSRPVSAGSYTDGRFTVSRLNIEGTATNGAVTKTFGWKFDQPTRYDACEARTTVAIGGQSSFQITIHADHLFSDSLVSASPKLRFESLAEADINNDGSISPSELATQDIGAYDPGSEGGIHDLWTWLVAQSHTLAHVDGESHCRSSVES